MAVKKQAAEPEDLGVLRASHRKQGPMALPDFFVIGVPKAGTSALHVALASHPQVLMSGVKEPKFFMCDSRPPRRQHGPGDAHSSKEWIWRRDQYEALCDGPDHLLRGESTPFYLYEEAAQQ